METRMPRLSKGLAAGMVAGAVLLGGTGQAATQTTTTTSTTSSTTTTTLLPHPFSAATRDCVREARSQLKACRHDGGGTACATDYQAAFVKCFAAPAGVKCATSCETKQSKCLASAPTTQKSCDQTCRKTYRTDVADCRTLPDNGALWAGQDASCLTTASANMSLCKFTCAEAELDCRNAFTNCIANCQNL